MPALVALQELVLLFAGLGDCAVRLLVRKLHGRAVLTWREPFDLPETQRECALGVLVQVLAGEDQQTVLEKSSVDLLPGRVVQFGEVDVGDNRTQSSVRGRDGDGHWHLPRHFSNRKSYAETATPWRIAFGPRGPAHVAKSVWRMSYRSNGQTTISGRFSTLEDPLGASRRADQGCMVELGRPLCFAHLPRRS